MFPDESPNAESSPSGGPEADQGVRSGSGFLDSEVALGLEVCLEINKSYQQDDRPANVNDLLYLTAGLVLNKDEPGFSEPLGDSARTAAAMGYCMRLVEKQRTGATIENPEKAIVRMLLNSYREETPQINLLNMCFNNFGIVLGADAPLSEREPIFGGWPIGFRKAVGLHMLIGLDDFLAEEGLPQPHPNTQTPIFWTSYMFGVCEDALPAGLPPIQST